MTTRNKTMINSLVIICLMFGIAVMPPVGSITPFGMKILGVFIGCLYAYATGIIIWPTILGFFLLSAYQEITIQAILSAAFGNQTLWLIVWALVFCYAIGKCGLLTVLSKWIISLKLTRKGPYWMIFMFWVAAWLVSAVTLSTFPVLILLWSIFYDVMKQVGIKKYSAYANSVLIGMAFPVYLGSCTLPFNPWAQIIGSLFSNMGVAVKMSFGKYTVFLILVAIVYFILAIAVTKFIIRPKIDFDINEVSMEKIEFKLNLPQKIGVFSLIGLVIFLLVPSFIPTMQWMNNIGITGGMILIAVILTFVPIEKGSEKKVLTIEEAFKRGIDWKQFFLLAMCFYVASLLSAESTGIMLTIKDLLLPIFDGRNVAVTIMLLTILGAMLTNILNNMVCATLMAPIAMMVAASNDINIMIFVLIFSIILIQGCVFPSGSAMGAILHGNMEYIKAKDIYIYATVYALLMAVIVGILAILCKGLI